MAMKESNGTIVDVDQLESPRVEKREGWIVRYRERARGWVTGVLLSILAVILLYPMVALPLKWLTLEQVERLLSLLLPAVTGLLGAVLGFYFGASSGRE